MGFFAYIVQDDQVANSIFLIQPAGSIGNWVDTQQWQTSGCSGSQIQCTYQGADSKQLKDSDREGDVVDRMAFVETINHLSLRPPRIKLRSS